MHQPIRANQYVQTPAMSLCVSIRNLKKRHSKLLCIKCITNRCVCKQRHSMYNWSKQPAQLSYRTMCAVLDHLSCTSTSGEQLTNHFKGEENCSICRDAASKAWPKANPEPSPPSVGYQLPGTVKGAPATLPQGCPSHEPCLIKTLLMFVWSSAVDWRTSFALLTGERTCTAG